MRYRLFALSTVCGLAFAGCAVDSTTPLASNGGAAIRGSIHGGQQPVSGAHLYLFAANTTGYGQPSVSLLKSVSGSTALDQSGGPTNNDYYVTSANDGSWVITGDYTCTPNSQVYLYSLGGNSGSGNNPASGLMAVLGNCPSTGSFSGSLFVQMNEVTTIAAAYAFAGFAVDATHVSSSGTALALTGITNAFANAANLANIATGAAQNQTVTGTGTVPTIIIDTLANVLSSCINSTGGGLCPTLFGIALSGGATGTAPTDTATAAINIAHYPTNNPSGLFALTSSNPAFSNARQAPSDFGIGITYSGLLGNEANDLAVDAAGNVWIADSANNAIFEMSPLGKVLSPAGGFTGGGLADPWNIAIDPTGNIWVANYTNPNSTVTKLTSAGAVASGTNPFSGGGLSVPTGIAADGFGNIWVDSYQTGVLTEISKSGTFTSGVGYPDAHSDGIAIDGSGNAWTAGINGLLYDEVSPNGTLTKTFSNRTGNSINLPHDIAMDSAGNAWIVNTYLRDVYEITNDGTGTALGGGYSNGYQPGFFQGPTSIAIDGAGYPWVTDYLGSSIAQLSPAGNVLTGTAGISGFVYGPAVLALDGSGNLWTVNFGGNFITQYVGLTVPVITPISAGLPTTATTNGTSNLGTRP